MTITLLMVGLGVGIALLQTTWLSGATVLGVRPDLVLIVLTYSAYSTGVQRGQVTGFIVGFVEDSISVSPPGFHAVVRLLHSAVVGLTRGSITGDAVLTPVTLTAIAFGIKMTATLVTGSILRLEVVTGRVFSTATLLEGVLTVVLAPFAFWLLRRGFDRFIRRTW